MQTSCDYAVIGFKRNREQLLLLDVCIGQLLAISIPRQMHHGMRTST